MSSPHADFVHLHVHTQYSLLDGAIKLDELVATAKDYNMPALAITDHGVMFGTIDFYRKATSAGIKPIIGCEVYIASKTRLEKEERNYHLVLLAKNLNGYKNLCRIVSDAYLNGFYYKPRTDKEFLAQHSDGLIALSACLKGEIPQLILSGRLDAATATAKEYAGIFGPDNFYLELQKNGIPEQYQVNTGLKEVAKSVGLGLVATNDCHYLKAEDAEAHEVLLCIQTGKKLQDENRMRMSTHEFYLRSPHEMKELFADEPEAVANSLKIAERCNLELEFGKFHFPRYDPPDGKDLNEYLEELAREGLEKRFQEIAQSRREALDEAAVRKYEDRLVYELEIINKMGFPGYFLIVQDFINWAKAKGIPVGPGRGSAAGSVVAWALRITDLDPIRYKLLFERFLNPGRISMPDIDIDFCMDRREEVIEYVTNKYGSDKVAQIITFGTMAAKGVIRDVGRVLNMSYGEVDRIAKLVPNVLKITLDKALEMEPKLKQLEQENDQVRLLLRYARALEGLTRHASTHAAGLVIASTTLTDFLPLYKSAQDKGVQDKETHKEVVTQFSMEDVEKIGLIKFDFLGLRTLTVIDNAVKLIGANRGIKLDIDNLPMDDELTYDLLCQGDTSGVFQLESSGMKELLVKLKPRVFEDIVALVALYRPGPLGSGMVDDFIQGKHGKKEISYLLPQLEDILKETYGVMVYQEQVMQIASTLAGFSLGDGDNLRRAMGKKKEDVMAKQKDFFLEGSQKNEIPKEDAERIFDLMAKFSGYGFNKSHSAAYALVAYQTAYLKAHFPVEFIAALLSSEVDDTDKVVKYIYECRNSGIPVLPPDINESEHSFSVNGDSIRFGLAAVKNVGGGAIESIIEAREEGGKFQSLSDFCERIDLRRVNRRVLESLIKCGACDSLKRKRAWMMAALDAAVASAQAAQKDRESGQMSLFAEMGATSELAGEFDHNPDIEEWPDSVKLRFEKETIGYYVTGHPLEAYIEEIKGYLNLNLGDLHQAADKQEIKVACVVNSVQEKINKRGEKMAFLTVEDLTGVTEIIVFADVYEKSKDLLGEEAPIFICGKVDRQEEQKKSKIIASEILNFDQAKAKFTNGVHFILNLTGLQRDQLQQLKSIVRQFPGKTTAFLHLIIPDKTETVMKLPDNMRVAPSGGLSKNVDDFFGYRVTYYH